METDNQIPVQEIKTNLAGWENRRGGFVLEQRGALFRLVSHSGRNLIQKDKSGKLPSEFHELVPIFDDRGNIAGIAGRLGADLHLLIPDTDGDEQIFRLSESYATISKVGDVFHGRIRAELHQFKVTSTVR